MITKRLFFILLSMPMAVSSFADSGLSGLSDAADGVGSYLPYVQGVCYVIAAVIVVAGAMSIYMSMQTNPNQIRKRMMMTAGSCMCFVCMATALPQFFGVDGTGSSSSGSNSSVSGGGSSDGFLASDQGGISQSGIITDIPSIRDRTGNWITFPQGTNMAIANQLISIYEHFGSGIEGTYGRTLDYIQREYWSGNMDYNTFNQMMSAAGNLPHN